MKLSLVDQLIHKDRIIGRYFVKAETHRREQLNKFRERFNKTSIQNRIRSAKELADQAAFNIPEEDGFLITNSSAFPEVPALIQRAREIVAENDPEELRRNKKEQLLTGLLKKKWLSYDSPFMQFAMRPEIAATVSNYLGMTPVLTRVDVWYSKASPELSNSQLHHCDFESMRQLKLFIYATDVTEETGPLVMMKASDSDRVRDQIKYRYGQKIEDSVIDPIVPPEQQFKALGDAGTMIFGDTSRCFHYGSRVHGNAKSRTVIMFQFLRPQSFHMPLKFANNCPYSAFSSADLPEYQRQLLGAE